MELDAAASKTTYTYYSNKKVKTKKIVNSSGKNTDYKRYNQKGQVIVDYNYRKNGSVYEVRTYHSTKKLKTLERRNNGKKTDYKKYNKNGKMTTDYDYCPNGNVKKLRNFNTSGKVVSTKNYHCIQKTNLTISQFNVLKPTDTTYGSWNSRKNKIGSTLNLAGSDIVSLNEVYDNNQITDIQNMTSYKVIKPTGSQPHGWSSAIAYNPKKVKLITSGAYFFKNQETYTTGSLAGKKASRTAVWGVFEKNGIKFLFISGHTQNDWYTNVRFKQIDEMNALGKSLASKYNIKNIIIAGDFNAHNYKNSNCTKSNPTYVGGSKKLGYDYICSNRGTNNSGSVLNSGASDHALVYTNTTISRN